LHVRSTYDVPHVGHLVLVGFLATAALVTPAGLSPVFVMAAAGWLAIWALHAVANVLAGGRPYRCNLCGSPIAPPAVQADLNEHQRLHAALAKAAAKRAGTATATVAIVFAFTASGVAQQPRQRFNLNTARPTRFAGELSPSDSYNEPASYKSDWQIERERVLAKRRASRDAAKERREKTWASLPFKFYSDEELARPKYNVAHMLWQNGKLDAAKNILAKLLDDYPKTDTADRAKGVLERF
jgi:hypothetical protein